MCGLFPPEFEREALLADGRRVRVRPLNFDEYERLERLYQGASAESLHKRFGWADPRAWLRAVKGAVETDHMCLIAESACDAGVSELVADCWYFVDREPGSAEVSILVRDDFQHRRLGTQLMEQLVRVGHEQGLHRLYALVGVSNTPMLRIIRRLKFRFVHGADGVNLYRLDL
jgi:RimJ/RimL family protein N-acetyltransferase